MCGELAAIVCGDGFQIFAIAIELFLYSPNAKEGSPAVIINYMSGKITVLFSFIALSLQLAIGQDSNSYSFNDAVSYMNDTSSTPDERAKAYSSLTRLGAKGDGQALNELGVLCATGNMPECPKDCKKAIDFFTRAWNAGFAKAAHNLSIIYLQGDCVPADTIKFNEWTMKGAEAGDEVAMHNLGCLYANPKYSHEVDSISALGWFRKAAESGYGDSMWELSRFYHNKGNGEEARYWLQQGANLDHMQCLHGLGLMHKNGSYGQPVDLDSAAVYFKKCADMYGFADSQMEYGVICDEKYANFNEAAKYFIAASEQGNVYSIVMIGNYCVAGKGGFPKDESQAFKYYKLGTETRPTCIADRIWSMYCMARVGLAYYLGKGVPQNKQEGRDILYWLAEQDFPTAKEYIQKLNIR